MITSLKDFEKVTGFYKSAGPLFSKMLHINSNFSQNVSHILLCNGLVMVTNDESIA